MTGSDDRVIRLSPGADVPPHLHGCALSVGNFDGVHLGHRRMLSIAKSRSPASGAPVVAMTFDPLPDSVLRPGQAPPLLMPPRQRFRLLVEAGADAVAVVGPDEELLAMSAEEFIRGVVWPMRPVVIIEGPDFRFGRGREGDPDMLRELGRRYGFEVHIAEPATVDIDDQQRRISSTLVRELVSGGRVEEAAECLGRPFAMYGQIVHGAGQGRVLEFPTANLEPGEFVVPADGVYAGRAEIAGRAFAAAVSVGTKPTLGPAPRVVEAFLIDAEGTFYDEQMCLWFLRRLRDQRKFAGIEELKRQIAEDVQRVRETCQH